MSDAPDIDVTFGSSRRNRHGLIMDQFTPPEIEALEWYVYAYSDPLDSRPFYIGKGIGNKAFTDLTDGDTAKLARMREIREVGLEPQIEILAFGLDTTTASKVEAVAVRLIGAQHLINQLEPASRGFERMDIERVRARLALHHSVGPNESAPAVDIDSRADSTKRSPIDQHSEQHGAVEHENVCETVQTGDSARQISPSASISGTPLSEAVEPGAVEHRETMSRLEQLREKYGPRPQAAIRLNYHSESRPSRLGTRSGTCPHCGSRNQNYRICGRCRRVR